MISLELKKEIQQYAINQYPKEMCGFIVDGNFMPVTNVHEDPNNYFRVSPASWHTYAQICTAFIHSHPDWYSCPSEADMKQQIASAIPWGIVATDGKTVTDITFFGDQISTPDLKNRPFCHGVTDCYSIIRDWYRLERGVLLKEVPRSWEWWEGDDDLYSSNFKDMGFEIVPTEQIMAEGPKIGDVFLANIGHNVLKLNHGGVYTGNGLGLHHITSKKPVDTTRLAKEEPIQRWLQYISLWIRYNET